MRSKSHWFAQLGAIYEFYLYKNERWICGGFGGQCCLFVDWGVVD